MYVRRDIVRYAISSLLLAMIIASVVVSAVVFIVMPMVSSSSRSLSLVESRTEGVPKIMVAITSSGIIVENQGVGDIKVLYIITKYINGSVKIINVSKIVEPNSDLNITISGSKDIVDVKIVTKSGDKAYLVHPAIEYRIPILAPSIAILTKTGEEGVGKEGNESSEGEYTNYTAELIEGSESFNETTEENIVEEIIEKIKNATSEVGNGTIEIVEEIIEEIANETGEGIGESISEIVEEIISTLEELTQNGTIEKLKENLSNTINEVSNIIFDQLVQLILKDIAELKQLMMRLAYYEAYTQNKTFDEVYKNLTNSELFGIVKSVFTDLLLRLAMIMAYNGDYSIVEMKLNEFKQGFDMFMRCDVSGIETMNGVLGEVVSSIRNRDRIPIVYDLVRYVLLMNDLMKDYSIGGIVGVNIYEDGNVIHVYIYLLDLGIDISIGDNISFHIYKDGDDITKQGVEFLKELINIISAIIIGPDKLKQFVETVKNKVVGYLEYVERNGFSIPASISNRTALSELYLAHLYLEHINDVIAKELSKTPYGLYDDYRVRLRSKDGVKEYLEISNKTLLKITIFNITLDESIKKLCQYTPLYCGKWLLNLTIKDVKTGSTRSVISITLNAFVVNSNLDRNGTIDRPGKYELHIYVNVPYSDVIECRKLLLREVVGNMTIDKIKIDVSTYK